MPGPIVSAGELPWWLDPAKKSVTDPLYITLARRAASAVGLDNPEAAVMGAASPLGLAGEVPAETMMHPSKPGSIKGGAAVWELLKHLQDFAAKEPEAVRAMPGNITGRYIPPPGAIKAPEGFQLPIKGGNAGAFGGATSITRMPELEARRKLLLEQLARTKPQVEVPRISSMDELKDIVGRQGPAEPPPPLSRIAGTGAARTVNKKTNKLNEDLVRTVRKMGAEGQSLAAIGRQLNLNPSTLSEVLRGGSWAWVK